MLRLLKLGFDVSERSVARYLRRRPRRGDSARRWTAFLANHREAIVACDFFTVPTLTFQRSYLHGHSALSDTSCRHCRGPSHVGERPMPLEELSGVREGPMIIPMATTGRTQQRYDHRLRNLVQRTGDVTVAHGVPIRKSVPVATVDVAGDDE